MVGVGPHVEVKPNVLLPADSSFRVERATNWNRGLFSHSKRRRFQNSIQTSWSSSSGVIATQVCSEHEVHRPLEPAARARGAAHYLLDAAQHRPVAHRPGGHRSYPLSEVPHGEHGNDALRRRKLITRQYAALIVGIYIHISQFRCIVRRVGQGWSDRRQAHP